MATNNTWSIIPGRLTRANELIESIRKRGGKFKLHPDRQGWGLKTPKNFPISPELHDEVYFYGEEVLYLLRQEKGEDLALEP